MFLREHIFLAPFCFTFSLFSLSLIFLYLQVDLLYASASETNRVGFYRIFITKIREGGGLYSGRQGGISKLWMKIDNYKQLNELTTLFERYNTGYVNGDEMMRVRDVQNGWV